MRILLACTLVFMAALVARGELVPDEVAIIAMSTSPQGKSLAEHYAKARGVPQANIFLLDGKPGLAMARTTWEQEARPAIRAWLSRSGLETKIRCFVTCWDVPLKIGRRDPNAPEVAARKEALAKAREALIGQIEEQFKALEAIAPGAAPPARSAPDAKTPLAQLATDFDAAFKAAGERVKTLNTEEERKQANAAVQKAFVSVAGWFSFLQLVARQSDPSKLSPQAVQELEKLRGQVIAISQKASYLVNLSDNVDRDKEILALIPQIQGLIGTLRWVDEQQVLLEKNETGASFDSELSLVLWPDYRLFRWQPNLLHYGLEQVQTPLRTLMVSRLAAPKLELAFGLVDAAIATEKTGLTGKVYIDAKGEKTNPKGEPPGSYGLYEQSLRDLAARLQQHTKLEVVLNNVGKLFQPGECPDAALYCGWYSLGNYVDAFDWRPGAVGYHIASMEATDLLDPTSHGWCPAMLLDGVAATLGPVEEPYLASFPLPEDFFCLLLTGRYTLAETYYRTAPFTSWQMVLVGDPLYNPFKAHPALDESALPDRMKPRPPGALVPPGVAPPGAEQPGPPQPGPQPEPSPEQPSPPPAK